MTGALCCGNRFVCGPSVRLLLIRWRQPLCNVLSRCILDGRENLCGSRGEIISFSRLVTLLQIYFVYVLSQITSRVGIVYRPVRSLWSRSFKQKLKQLVYMTQLKVSLLSEINFRGDVFFGLYSAIFFSGVMKLVYGMGVPASKPIINSHWRCGCYTCEAV